MIKECLKHFKVLTSSSHCGRDFNKPVHHSMGIIIFNNKKYYKIRKSHQHTTIIISHFHYMGSLSYKQCFVGHNIII